MLIQCSNNEDYISLWFVVGESGFGRFLLVKKIDLRVGHNHIFKWHRSLLFNLNSLSTFVLKRRRRFFNSEDDLAWT